jgi:hypothetical protein
VTRNSPFLSTNRTMIIQFEGILLSQHVVDDWNGLREEVVDALNVESFKRRLDMHQCYEP